MAKIQCELMGDYSTILHSLEKAVLEGSLSATLEGSSNFDLGNGKCSVRVYERYSAFGGNRVSMSLTLCSSGDRIFVSVITSGGSQAVFFKVNTIGEESFLETIENVIVKYKKK